MAEHPSCSICNNAIPPSPEGSITTGYGILPGTDKKVCYPCCAELDKQLMRDTGKITLYLSCERWAEQRRRGSNIRGSMGSVQNWCGSLKILGHTRSGKHNIAGTRYDVWFRFEGYEWWGVSYGEYSQLVHCKRTKQKV